jgi:hypothetical protein
MIPLKGIPLNDELIAAIDERLNVNGNGIRHRVQPLNCPRCPTKCGGILAPAKCRVNASFLVLRRRGRFKRGLMIDGTPSKPFSAPHLPKYGIPPTRWSLLVLHPPFHTGQ